MRNYLLLTPGPLSTSETVKEAMLQDWCTWDKDYNEGIVTVIRKELLEVAYNCVVTRKWDLWRRGNFGSCRETYRQVTDYSEWCLWQTDGGHC